MPLSKKEITLSKIWKEVDQQTHYLIADILNRILPLPNLRNKKVFNLNEDADYRTLLVDFENLFSERPLGELKLMLKEGHPEPLPEQVAYRYFLLVIKSLVNEMRNFGCHDESYLNF